MTMRAISITPVVPRGASGRSLARRLAAAATRWWLSYLIWRIERAATGSLWSPGDRVLWDTGLARTEVLRAVKDELVRARESVR